jgi:Uri superfamily endonuclease
MEVACINLIKMWHVDHLLGNNSEICNYITAVSELGLANKHVSTTIIARRRGTIFSYAVRAEML